MKTDPNEPINPCEIGFKNGEIQYLRQVSDHTAQSNGLTKREYFAAMAMQGYATKTNWPIDDIVRYAVKAADALITELNK